MSRRLARCTVVVTRERPGQLARLLEAEGATVVHVPLIEVVDVEDSQRSGLDEALNRRPDWVIVTSPAGAERVGAVSQDPSIRLAAVGTSTAQRLAEVAGRPVDLVPDRQIAASLVEAFVDRAAEPQRVVVAQADLAGDVLASGLAAAGHDVDVHVAYRTLTRTPSATERERIADADAVVFASGSAATGWVAAFSEGAAVRMPSIVVAIGPTTQGVAEKSGLKVTHTATEHSLAGIIEELSAAWLERSSA